METEVAIVDNRIDPLTAVHNFGQLSIVMASAMPLIWRFLMRDTFNTGFKVGAYINMIFSAPFGFIYALFFMLGESRMLAGWLDSAMRFSVAGPYFFNFFAIYVIVFVSVTDSSSSVLNYPALAGYVVYSAAIMYYQYLWVPGVARYYQEESVVPSQNSYKTEVGATDQEDSPDMDDASYLDKNQEEAGEWPSEEKEAEMF